MKPIDLLEFYKNQRAIALRLGITEQAVGHWFRIGDIPEGRQYQLEIMHEGAIKADRPCRELDK